LFWDLPEFRRFDYLGAVLQLEMTANSTYCEANLFSDDPKSREMKKTPVFGNRFFPGMQGEQQYPVLKKDTPPNNPDTGSVCQSDDPVFLFQGKCVNTCGKYRYNRLF
jgi:hypothetical protein